MQRFLKTGLVTCLAIIFSLVIYGCGGGGSSGPPPVVMPTAEQQAAADAATKAANDAAAALETAIADVTLADTAAATAAAQAARNAATAVDPLNEATVTAANNAATAATEALTALNMAEEEAVEARLAELRMQENTVDTSTYNADYGPDAGTYEIEPGMTANAGNVDFTCDSASEVNCIVVVAEDGTVTNTGGQATAAQSEAGMAAITADEEAAAVAATKAAATKTEAIDAESKQAAAADAGLGGSAHVDADGTPGNADDPYGLKITRDRDGTKIEITDHGMTGDDDPKFMQAMDLGGGRTMHTRTMEADADGDVEKETVIVTTDIEAPKGVAFAKWQNATGGTPQALDVMGNDGEAPSGDETANALEIAPSTDTDVKPNLMFVRTVTSGTLTYTDDDTGTTGTDEAVHDGTYNGAEGTYRCTGTGDCTVTFNDKGMVTAHTGAWVFIPDAGATSDQPDYDYLHYGVWLKTTTDEDDVVTYDEVETFADSSIAASDGGELDTVTGSASYEGGATGVYVHQVLNAAGNVDSATSGHFTADVALTAYFGQTLEDTDTTAIEAGQLAPNLLNTVSGTINNFELSGEEANTWSVAVQASRATGANIFTGTAKGGLPSNDGSISGTYHGPTPETAAANDGTTRVAPGSMVGEFNSFFNNGSVAGAFGARKE